MLVEYLDKLKEVGLNFEVADASQTTITKKKVVQCLQRIRQHNLADILAARQGEPSSCKHTLFGLTCSGGSSYIWHYESHS